MFFAVVLMASAAAYAAIILSAGIGLPQIFRLAITLGPFIVIGLIAGRKYWLATMLIAWTAYMRIPIVPLDAVTVGFLCLFAICLLFVLERFMIRQPILKADHWAVVLLLGAGMILVFRFLMDRPGSARLGAGGGLRNAVAYTAAIPLFFVTDQLAREQNNARKIFRAVYILSLLMLGWTVAMRLHGRQSMPFYFGWYERSAWLLMPMALAWLIERARSKGRPPLFALLFCVFFVLLAVLSPFRSRVYFAVASIAAVFWRFGYRRRLAAGAIVLFCIVLPILTFAPKDKIPVPARRALSTILPYDHYDIGHMRYTEISVSSEIGWRSDFRISLAEMALHHIRQKPLAGQGWAFTAAELEWAMTFALVDWTSSALVTAGDYHNSILTIAVKAGLPAALLLSIALIALLFHSVIRAKQIEDGPWRTLYAGMTGAFAAIAGQMLMNGGGEDLQAVCILLGFFYGTQRRLESGEKSRLSTCVPDTTQAEKSMP